MEAKTDDVQLSWREQLEVGSLVDPGGQALRQVEVPLDHLAVARAAVGPQRRPDGERPHASGGLGAPVPEVRLVIGGEVGRGHAKSPLELGAVAHEGETAVVGHVQPLVAVGDHRVGALDAGRKPSERAASSGRRARMRRRCAARRRSARRGRPARQWGRSRRHSRRRRFRSGSRARRRGLSAPLRARPDQAARPRRGRRCERSRDRGRPCRVP